MAVKVRHQGLWKDMNGAWVRQGTEWKSIKHLFVATHTTFFEGDEQNPPDLEPVTHYKLIRSFVAPDLVPAIPSLTVTPGEGNGGDPGGGGEGGNEPGDPFDPDVVRVAMPPISSHLGMIPRSWTREVLIQLEGSAENASFEFPDPDTAWHTFPWGGSPGYIRARQRYANEAGVGAWSSESARVWVNGDVLDV